MNATRRILAVIANLACCLTATIAFAQVTADDFLPPVSGGPTDVKQPDQVAMKGKTVTAPTAQDAVKAAVQQNVKELANGDTPEVGAKMVKFPSGLGFVASGVAPYRTMENPTATRIAKRKAYVIAFTMAKKNLAEILGGLTNEGKEEIRESLVNINLPKEEMTNISTQSEESLKQAVEMLTPRVRDLRSQRRHQPEHRLGQYRDHAQDSRQVRTAGAERPRSRESARRPESSDRRGP